MLRRWQTATIFNTLLGYGLVASKLGSGGSAAEWNPGHIKLCGMNIDPGKKYGRPRSNCARARKRVYVLTRLSLVCSATGKEQGAAYGFKGTGEQVLPAGCTKRIYPSQMAEIDAEKTALMSKVASIYKPFL